MGWDKIIDIISVGFSWWTPEKVKARARQKLKNLKKEENAILKKKCTWKNSARLGVIRSNIKRLQDYLANN